VKKHVLVIHFGDGVWGRILKLAKMDFFSAGDDRALVGWQNKILLMNLSLQQHDNLN
jgi:hypothetical protein